MTRVYLSTPLFSEPGSDRAAPRGVAVLEGDATLAEAGWIEVYPTAWFDERARPLEPAPAVGTRILLPPHKVDHLRAVGD